MASAPREPIAIIGSGCRLPGAASSPSKLWELLRKPRDVLKKIDRFNTDGFYHSDGHHHGTANVQHAHLIDEDFRLFDAGFFGIKPVEAESIDPLQRILLETVYESLENAGLPLERLQGSDTAFYAGVMATDYTDILMRDIDTFPQYFATATARSIISNRVSYVFDWHGPSMTIDTACSSSMLALHGAIQSLRNGESQIAVAAGANLILGPELFIALSKVNMLSPKGRSAMWDADVDGYGRGEGFVSIVLKRLSDAIRDGDSVDCIIRESGLNQDGKSKGITMPSSEAQAALIRRTYACAGLDLRRPEDHPQYFEAHGTGTQAGDPREAEAIYTAFCDQAFEATKQKTPLYVGGIKTVVGHTEGTAGLAGLLKASLCLQAGFIPPNLLFNKLNPEITPFYGPLEVPTKLIPWPRLPDGVPRRASVNSFGFGGANAHVILESYSPPYSSHNLEDQAIVAPFVFSASSEKALQATLSSYKEYLESGSDVNLADLNWTLEARRSALPVKAAFPASKLDDLVSKISAKLEHARNNVGTSVGLRSVIDDRRILGVFTGQGAQWARMGASLIETFPLAKGIVDNLDLALQALPVTYRPTWSLLQELQRPTESSRMQEAAFSQPLCTVIQIILVSLLQEAGVQFSAVVGHSSGEIGAAFAAGYLSAVDATKIAYLRGLFAALAQGSSDQKGGMMAVGTSPEEADEICSRPEFRGRISLAASNSSSSVTLSGDIDAIARAKSDLDEKRVFARVLKVDTAYHSYHMAPCAAPYVEALGACNITILSPTGGCRWFSSVSGGVEMEASEELRDIYWKDNMIKPVLFAQSITSAVQNDGRFNLALEIGPHAALKGPASQTLAELGLDIPYISTLQRGQDDIASLADCLGSIWVNLGALAVDFKALRNLVPTTTKPRVLKNLPNYAWDHEKPYWFEPRKSKQFRTRADPPHELLGVRNDDGDENEYRWRNFLSIQELPWLEGHQIQGQVVYPAAGYISMALEAAQIVIGPADIDLIELEDLVIGRAIAFDDEKTSVEVTTTLTNVTEQPTILCSQGKITADFSISAHLGRDKSNLTRVASGKLSIALVAPDDAGIQSMATRELCPAHLIDMDDDRFYTELRKIGYGYSDQFRMLSNLRRRMNFCTGSIVKAASSKEIRPLLVHPGMLDHAFQALFGAYCWPGDGRFWTLFLPTSVHRLTVNVSALKTLASEQAQFCFDAWLKESPSTEMRGDVVFYSPTGDDQRPVVQFEGASMLAINETTPRDDRPMFYETVWGVSALDGNLVVGDERASEQEYELAEACERVGHYYWRQLEATLNPKDRDECADHHKHLLNAISHLLDRPIQGNQTYIKSEWLHDDEKIIEDLVQKYSSSVDIRLHVSVGRALPAVVRGETTMLEHMRPDNMLDDFYEQSLGLPATNRYLGRMIKQLTHRYPRMNFIEIGAGTGSSTKAIFSAINGAYESYTYTDISSGFFENAAAQFGKQRDKIIFKTLDVEKPPASQGYTPNSFDVVVASNILHATTDLHNTLQNVRTLLKPGGFLFLLEITNNTSIRYSFTMGGLPGWWMGVGDERIYSPCISTAKWHHALRKAGFGGVDATTPARDVKVNPFSVIAAQAIDVRTEQLRRPALKTPQGEWNDLYILGGQQLETANIIEDVTVNLESRFRNVVVLQTIEDLIEAEISVDATVLSLLSLDEPVWKGLSATRLKALQQLFQDCHNILWITYAQERDDPYANSTVGFLRSVSAELPTLRAQVLDFDIRSPPLDNTRLIVEALLRLVMVDEWERDPGLKDGLLWTTEPELRYRDGKLWLQRVLPHKSNNDRINAQRRLIQTSPDEDVLIELSYNNNAWELRQGYNPGLLPSQGPLDIVTVKARYSTLWPQQLSEHEPAIHLIVGQLSDTNEWVVALSSQRCSVLDVERSWTIPIPDLSHDPLALITALQQEILAQHVAVIAGRSSGTTLIHEPEFGVQLALTRIARERNLRLKFLTADTDQVGTEWLQMKSRMPLRTAQLLFPKDVFTYVHFDGPLISQQVKLAIRCLPSRCNIVNASQSFPHNIPLSSQGSENARMRLTELLGNVQSSLQTAGEKSVLASARKHLLALDAFQETPTRMDPLGMVDWRLHGPLQINVARLPTQTIFKTDRSYMLVGMTGEMGRSLCEWMVKCGAGAVILTSRNPKIDKAWVNELESAGCKIEIAAFDATQRDAWVSFAAEIEQKLPPLAGIINGAVVLQDRMFLDMDIDVFNGTLAPKIDSTIHLDEVFRQNALDFFIVFSSLSSIIGNRGQANYNAANAFMTSLLKQRQSRGQAASVIHLGSVVGVGFLTRAGDVMETILVRYGYMPVSEVDLHHLVAQAIMAGLPGCGENPDMITGLRFARDDEDSGLHWTSNPRFSHLILPPEKEEVDSGNRRAVASVRGQLATAASPEQAVGILQECFGTKLMSILQMSETSFRHDAALIELGVDSLVAVEIRSWFLKEINVDMPVLKVLGGASTIGLCNFAAEQLSPELVPSMKGAGQEPAEEPMAKDVQAGLPPQKAETGTDVGPGNDLPIAEKKDIGNESINLREVEVKTDDSSISISPPKSTSSPGDVTPTSSMSAHVEEAKPPPNMLKTCRLSSAQSRFWFLDMFLVDRTASNVTFSYNISGQIRVTDLSKAVKSVAQAHEALRVCFIAEREDGQNAMLGLMKTSKLQLEHLMVSSDAEIMSVYNRVRYTAYDLEQGEIMQIVLLTKSPTSHHIIFGYHHIVLDGVGFEALLADLERSYLGRSPSPQGLQYTEHCEAETLAVTDNATNEKISYWSKEYEEAPEPLPLLPVSKVTVRRAMDQYRSSYTEERLSGRLTSDIKSICKKNQVTPSHFYLATFRIMLMRLTGIDDLCIGLADANRHDSKVMSTVGLFLNMLPLRFRGQSHARFSDILRSTRSKVYEALGHAAVPFDDLLQALQVPRSSSHSPLFQAFFDYHQGAQEKLQFGNTTWENAERHPGERAYDVTLDIIEGSAGTLVALIGQDYLYGIPEMRKLLDCYLSLLQDFVRDPSIPANESQLYAQSQIDTALQLGRGPSMTFGWSETLGHRVQEMTDQYPDSIAIKLGNGVTQLTYREFRDRVNVIKAKLTAEGISLGDRVAVFQEPSPDWICSILAIFWAGAVYVPLVPQNPLPRLAATLKAAEATGVLFHQATAPLVKALCTKDAKMINIDHLPSSGEEAEGVKIPVSGDDPAVILFTSGSTGTPKGIILRHRNLANHIEGYVRAWDIGQEIVLQQSAYSFDLSIGQIFTALSMGGTLVVASKETRRDPAALAQLIHREGVTWTLQTPSEYSSLLQGGAQDLIQAKSWQHALSCGEALTRKLVTDFANLGHDTVRLYNCYGPAEAIISATMAEVPIRGVNDDGPVVIGSPNPNYSIYIIDDRGNLAPPGFPGEIVIGGCGVGLGYLNNEQLSKDKFRPSPIATLMDRQRGWERGYHTGDMGRIREDGMLMFEGRREGDSQVKIRGFRVDLLDIEATLLDAAKGVLTDAVITMRAESQILVAHVLFGSVGLPHDTTTWLADLLANLPLPEYMKPSVAIPVKGFEKNIHGKKDRSAIARLPITLDDVAPSIEATPLRTVEGRLAEVWRDLLPTEIAARLTFNSNSDFFRVGGNSLLLVKLQGRLREVFSISIPLLQLFDASLLGKMADKIEAARTVEQIAWADEVALEWQLLGASSNVDRRSTSVGSDVGKKQSRVVVLTGATGYMGPYLLKELIETPDIKLVHCVAVRGTSHAHAEDRVSLSRDPKVVVHWGDMAKPRLGLTRDVWEKLVGEVDLIVHSGARRSFWDSYHELRGSNVLSTKELVRMAAVRKVPVHFLSSSGVLHLDSGTDGAVEGFMATYHPPEDGSEGYVASKWASEVLLEKANHELGVPVSIHRFTPRSTVDNGSASKREALADLLEAMKTLGKIPERSTWAGRFDVIHTPTLAKSIMECRLKPGELKFVHHQGDGTFSPDELFDFVEENLGHLEKLGLLEWVGAVKRTGYHWLFSTHELALTTTEHGVTTTVVNRR